jgi:hypothetical protein
MERCWSIWSGKRLIDLLADRSVTPAQHWFEVRQTIELVSRDRGSTSTCGLG